MDSIISKSIEKILQKTVLKASLSVFQRKSYEIFPADHGLVPGLPMQIKQVRDQYENGPINRWKGWK